MSKPKPQIIIMNGTSSAGKSSAAIYIRDNIDDSFLHFQWDDFLKALPDNKKATDEDKKKLPALFQKAANEYLSNDQSLILDIVCVPGKTFEELVDTFSEYDPLTVRIRATPDILNEREKERGDRHIGLANEQHRIMYEGGEKEKHPEYGLELDSSQLSPEQLARAIIHKLNKAPQYNTVKLKLV